MNNEAEKAISSRINLALMHLQQGQVNECEKLLRQLKAVLPQPEARHVDAAGFYFPGNSRKVKDKEGC